MSKKIYKRFIKEESYKGSDEIVTIPTNTRIMEPLFLKITNNMPNQTCLKKLDLNNNKNLTYYNNYKCVSNVNDYKKYLYIPPIGISSSSLLKIYDIDSIDDLNVLYDQYSDGTINYITFNRVINCWIKNNIDFLKNNIFLEKIYYKLLSTFLAQKIISKINLEKEIKEYFTKLLVTKSYSMFEFDLLNDMINFLSKK
jgi:hypothetical protein